MRARNAPLLAWLLWLGSVILAVVGLFLLSPSSSAAPTSTGLLDRISDAGYLASPALFALVGAFVASRRPRNPIGWLIIITSLVTTTNGFLQSYATYGLLAHPGSLPGAEATLWILTAVWPLQWPSMFLLLLLFPNGHLPSTGWRPIAWLAVIIAVLYALANAVYPGPIPGFEAYTNPIGLTGDPAQWLLQTFQSPIVFGFFPNVPLAVSAVSVIWRFRIAEGDQRQQLKWFAYASVLVICAYALSAIGLLVDPVANIVQGLTIDALVVAIAIAVLRYRLYDIDLIIRRTLIYGTVTASLVLSYLGCVIALQTGLRTLTGQSSDLAIVASTLGIAAMFQPLRSRVQRLIDRRFYRRKYDAVQVLAAFGTTVRDEVQLSRLTESLVEVVGETMQPARVSLWLREMKSDTP